MLFWILVFLVIALGAGVLGFGGAAVPGSGTATALSAVVLVLIAVSWVAGRGRMG